MTTLEEALALLVPTYSEGGRGRKECPACKKFVGARVHDCACGHNFVEGETKTNVAKQAEPIDRDISLFATNFGSEVRTICYTPSDCSRLKVKLTDLSANGIVLFCDSVIDEYLNRNGALLTPDAIKYLGRYYLELSQDDLAFFELGVDEWFSTLIAELE